MNAIYFSHDSFAKQRAVSIQDSWLKLSGPLLVTIGKRPKMAYFAGAGPIIAEITPNDGLNTMRDFKIPLRVAKQMQAGGGIDSSTGSLLGGDATAEQALGRALSW